MKNRGLIIISIIFFLFLVLIFFNPNLGKISGKQVAEQPCSGAVGICKSSPCHLYASYSSSERCESVSGGSCDSGYYCCTALSTNPSISACTEIADCLQKHGRCMNNPCYLYSSYSTSEKCYSIEAGCEGKYCCSATQSGEYACISPTCSGNCKPSECSNYADCSTSSEKCASDKYCCSGSCCQTKADAPLLNIAANLPGCFNSSTSTKINGKLSFNLGANWKLPADNISISIRVFNDSLGFDNSKSISLRNFMNSATPSISTVDLIVNGKIKPSYDSCNKNVLATTYNANLLSFDFSFPEAGSYGYNINGNFIDENGVEVEKEIYGGDFTVAYSCPLSLGNISFGRSSGGAKFKNNDKIKCSVVTTGKFFGNLAESPNKLNFTLNYLSGENVFVYKTFLSDSADSGISCTNGKCYVEQTIGESHLGEWYCDVAVGDGSEWKYSSSSERIMMINSPPIFGLLIPNRTWETKTSYQNAYDIKKYFFDLDGDTLTYSAGGNYNLIINISSDGIVTLSQWPPEYVGNETIWFFADDGTNKTQSNAIILRVVGNISEFCKANWSCVNYTDCHPDYKKYCNSAIDVGECGLSYNGNYSEFETLLCANETIPEQAENISIIKNETPKETIVNIPKQSSEKTNKEGGVLVKIGTGFILLVIVSAIGWFIFKKRKKPVKISVKEESPVIKPVIKKVELKIPEKKEISNLDELENYINKMVERGGSVNEIKKKLRNVGWSEEDMNKIFNLIKLKNFIRSLKGKLSKEQIRELLLKKNWSKEIIDKALK